MNITLQQIRIERPPRVIRTYEDKYETCFLFQAILSIQRKNGKFLTLYAYYYPFAYAYSDLLPCFFWTREDICQQIMDAHPVEGYIYGIKECIPMGWEHLEEVPEKWMPLFHFLQQLSLNSVPGCYEMNRLVHSFNQEEMVTLNTLLERGRSCQSID